MRKSKKDVLFLEGGGLSKREFFCAIGLLKILPQFLFENMEIFNPR